MTEAVDDLDLAPPQAEALRELAATLSPAQTLAVARLLLTRFEGQALREGRFEFAENEPAAPTGLTVLYGSHSGHSAGVARALADRARAKGWAVNLADMADYARGSLKREHNLAIVVSTHGEGQPPESIAPFFQFVRGPRAPRLDDCQFAVLALGDRSYRHFCKVGADFDARLEQLGASRILSRVDLGVDFDDGAEAWSTAVLDAFTPRMTQALVRPVVTPPRSRRYDRENPWLAEVQDATVISGRGSTQHYAHIELSLEGSRIKYEAGDALGVRPENDPALVDQLIQALHARADERVKLGKQAGNEEGELADVLRRKVEIRVPAPSGLRKYAALGARTLDPIIADSDKTAAYLQGRDWLDVFREHPVHLDAQTLVELLPPLASRSYSIASSQAAHPDEVHLLVSRVDYEAHGRRRTGVASGYLAERVKPGDKVAVWIEPNSTFRLPADSNTPIVLIGAGTGIAPFRAFLQSRASTGASGKNWVFFGNRNARLDFSYQSEWLGWRKQGLLSRMDVAFSRDGARKQYVTHALRQAGRDLYDWIESGARLYLCGDRAKLSASVDQALADLVKEHGGVTTERALERVEQLRGEGRYLKDVY
jgi:sulfite reductase (NADPH) flavoprotein alpha-component